MADEEKSDNPKINSGKLQDLGSPDAELLAMSEIVTALEPLNQEQRSRIFEYLCQRFGLAEPGGARRVSVAEQLIARMAHDPAKSTSFTNDKINDIRSLKEIKSPSSAIQMATLVAYFLSEVASDQEKKGAISKADIERYFKMAGFTLPRDASFTLVNAKNAGYLDSAGAGQYKLNPVGYNLVTHRMGGDNEKQSRGAKKKPIKRNVRKPKRAQSSKK